MVKLDKVKWGFIGCGEVTEKKSGPAFALIEGSEVVAVMSRDKEKAQSYAKRHNIPRWYSDPQPANTEDTSMLVNKQNYLTEEYQPDDLVELSLTYASSDRWMKQEAADAFIRMCDELNAGGSPRMYASSTYRDYAYQVELYDQYVARNGQQWADSIAARPGYSEHQTGLTADVASTASGGLSQFEDSEEFQWMQQNAHRFGWILRYPQGKQTLTGYDYESWHYRYLGVELATQVYQSGLTYDEYYALYLAD